MYTCYLCIVMYNDFIHSYICTDKPVVQITTITSGLDSVSISWTSSTGNGSDACTIAFYQVGLTSQSPGGVAMATQVTMKSHTFTGLPNNTEFVFLLNAVSVSGITSKTEMRTVRTKMSESTYVYMHMYQYNIRNIRNEDEFLIFK